MTRDYSKFFLSETSASTPKTPPSNLTLIGWQPFFSQQTSVDALARTPPVRVTARHRSGLHIVGDGIDRLIPTVPDTAVGDWLLLDLERPDQSQVLERKTLIKRRAPGTDRAVQLIAANIETVFIVSSCNQDFNVARLERYVALALEADITPVIVLTKRDLVSDPAPYVTDAQAISHMVSVVALDARSDAPQVELAPWCKQGQTVAFLGSSGVGKSTLTNALMGRAEAATQTIREDDAKGRHTTTHRQLHMVPEGGLVLDTPGMRELQLTDAASGIQDLFSDLHAIAGACRFKDCEHASEPGCAVRAAVEAGQIDAARVQRWHKLRAEEAFNSASLSERRSKDRSFGKMVRRTIKQKHQGRWRPE